MSDPREHDPLKQPRERLDYQAAIGYVEEWLTQHGVADDARAEGYEAHVYDYLDGDPAGLIERPWLGVRVSEVSFSNQSGGGSYMQVDWPWGIAFCGQVERCIIALVEGWNGDAELVTESNGEQFWQDAGTDEEFWRLGEMLRGSQEGTDMPDPLIAALSPDEASDLMVALSEAIDRHGKLPEDECEAEQVDRWVALSERIDHAGDWEVADD